MNERRPLSIAILALGGQGGGVLADWIVALAEAQGWTAQSTSVPGVAQRTGATIYYIEILKAESGRTPVLSLMPAPGDVDIVLALEWMEAGRSILRGLVTPGRTTLIASTHRALAIAEKQMPGDGVANSAAVTEAMAAAAKRVIAFDMEALAAHHNSVISAAMFGALAGAAEVPFPREAFEAAIQSGGKGVAPSLAAFAAAFERAKSIEPVSVAARPAKRFAPLPMATGNPQLDAMLARIRDRFPANLHEMLFAGVKRLTDFQDALYADEYLDRMQGLLNLDAAKGKGHAFALAAAKYLAVAMAYDDVIRVADLKTRAQRFDRISKEVGIRDDRIVYLTEFMHPRIEEVLGTLPVGMAEWLENHPWLFRMLSRLIDKGRRVRTGTVGWFLALYLVSSLRPFRRRSFRHVREMQHIDEWLAKALGILPRNYELAVEVISCRRLIKGYSDTHARGLAKFDRVLSALPRLVERGDGGAWLKRLREAALLDEEGTALDGVLKTIASL